MATNNEFVEVLSSSAISDLKALNKELQSTKKGVNDANAAFKGLKLPSQFKAQLLQVNNILKNANALLRAQIQLQQQLSRANNQNANAQNQANNASITAERLNRERIRTERERLALSEQQRRATISQEQAERRQQATTDRLGSAYLQLSRQQAEAARRVQDLIVRGRTATQTQREYDRELRTAQNEFNRLNQRVLAADRAVGRFNRNVGNYPTQAIKGLKDLIGAFGVVGGVTAFAMIAKDIFNTAKELQSLNFALKQVVGSEEAVGETQAFLSRIAEDYGIEIKGLTRSYTSFYAASQNALAEGKISGQQLQDIFESVSKSAGAMGLSAEQQQGAFLALQQMISKGTIQAEEIRGQLAERLPGAFGILAKSMGVTEIQLNKLLKDGKVLATDVLPAFARELEKAYGVENLDRVESLAAATSRLGNAWTSFVEAIASGDSIISKALTGILNVLSDVLTGFERLAESEEQRTKRFETNYAEETYKKELKYLKDIEDVQKRREYADIGIDNETQRIKEAYRVRTSLYERQSQLEEKVSKEGFLGAFSPFAKELEAVNYQIEKAFRISAGAGGRLKAYREILDAEPEKKVDYSGGKTKRQKADIDYLREVFELRKQNAENEIEYSERIMNDEEKNYSKRLEAANNYYFQKEELLKTELEENIRVNNLEAKNQTEQYKQAIANGQASSENLTQIEYKRLIKEEKLYAEYLGNREQLTEESAKKLKGVLDSIQDQAQRNQINQAGLDDLRQRGLLLDGIGSSATASKFAELDNKMRELDEAEMLRQEDLLRVELQRTQAKIAEIKLQNVTVENNKAINDLKDTELTLQKQLVESENERKKAVADLRKEMKAATDEYLNSFTQGVFDDAGLGSLSKAFDQVTYTFINDLGEIETKTGSTFQKMFDQAQTTAEKFKVAFTSITEVAQEAFNFLNQNSQAYFDAQYSRLDREKEIALKFAGESESGRAEIERQYEERRREIRRRELQQQKEQALFNAVINTAQAVVAALPNIPLSIIVGAIGAAQIAAISAREIPAFKEGVRGFEGGMAWVGDGGRSEIIRTPSGGLYRTPSTDTLVNLPKGSDVYKSEMDFLRNSGTLLGGMPHIELEKGGLTKSDLADVMGNVMSGAATNITNFDKNGIRMYTIKSGGRHERFNRMVSFKSRTFRG